MTLTNTSTQQIGGDLFEIARLSFDGVREAAGFRRRINTTRSQYKINGKVVSRGVFFAVRDAAKEVA